MIKQKYQLQEEEEKAKMLAKQNTELKITNEGLRCQISNLNHNEKQMAVQAAKHRQQDAEAMVQCEKEQTVLI